MMHEPIVFTVSQMTTFILSTCAMLISLNAGVGVVIKFVSFIKRPEKVQDDNIQSLAKRIEVLENNQEQFLQYFTNDNIRIKSIEEGNQITQKALLALLSSALNEPNKDLLIRTKDELQNYLINR